LPTFALFPAGQGGVPGFPCTGWPGSNWRVWLAGCEYVRSAMTRAITWNGSCAAGRGRVVTWRRAQMVGAGAGRRHDVRAHQEPQAARRVPAVLRYMRSLHPPQIRIAIVCDLCRPGDYADTRCPWGL